MPKNNKKRIDSLRTLQTKMPRILKEVNSDSSLAIAAAANPFFALEHLDYEIAPGARREIELRARFGQEQAKEFEALEKAIYKAADTEFDLTDAEAVQETVATLLQSDQSEKTKRQK